MYLLSCDQIPVGCCTWKTLVRAILGSLFWMTEKSLLSGRRKSEGCTHCRRRFCSVARVSISVSWKKHTIRFLISSMKVQQKALDVIKELKVLPQDCGLCGGRAATGWWAPSSAPCRWQTDWPWQRKSHAQKWVWRDIKGHFSFFFSVSFVAFKLQI